MQELEVKDFIDQKELLDNNANIKPKNLFTIQYDDEDPLDFKIGDNIHENAPIIKMIRKFNVGESFNYNGENIRLISKDI